MSNNDNKNAYLLFPFIFAYVIVLIIQITSKEVITEEFLAAIILSTILLTIGEIIKVIRNIMIYNKSEIIFSNNASIIFKRKSSDIKEIIDRSLEENKHLEKSIENIDNKFNIIITSIYVISIVYLIISPFLSYGINKILVEHIDSMSIIAFILFLISIIYYDIFYSKIKTLKEKSEKTRHWIHKISKSYMVEDELHESKK